MRLRHTCSATAAICKRLCRYISRPAVSEKRLSLTPNGNVRYRLKTPYRESLPRERSECRGHGTTHVIFEPLDFIARLAALAPKTLALLAGWALPKPRVNLTRYHGVFAPNSQHRARVTPAKRGRGGQHPTTEDQKEPTPAERRASMTWAQRLKRVFGIDIETCPACGGAVRIMPKALATLAGQALACIEDPVVVDKILRRLAAKGAAVEASRLPPCRAPPQRGLFD